MVLNLGKGSKKNKINYGKFPFPPPPCYGKKIYFFSETREGGGDNLQNFDLAKNHLTIGSDHKINDFCFLKFFISMKFDPHQAQKTIFHRFEQCGISLDMFERVK